MTALGTVAEVAAVLAEHGSLRCVPSVTVADGVVTVTIAASADGGDMAAMLTLLDLRHAMEYLVGACQVRGFTTQYGINPDDLAAVLDGTHPRGDTESLFK